MMMIESFDGEYRWLSNFWICRVSIMLDEEVWTFASVEHGYQASKADSAADRERIARAVTPGYAKRLGRTVRKRPGWEESKLRVMEQLLRDKFTRHEDLRTKLIATGDAMIIEGNTWGDTYWGVCKGKGENHLGRLLMTIRGELFYKSE